MTAFVVEVARVLKQAGHFAYADFRPAAEVPHLLADLSEGPLVLKSSEDIAANVLVAMRADSDRKSELIDTIVNRLFRRPFRRFAGIRTSSTFEKFGSGELHYIYAHLVATASGRVETTQIAYAGRTSCGHSVWINGERAEDRFR